LTRKVTDEQLPERQKWGAEAPAGRGRPTPAASSTMEPEWTATASTAVSDADAASFLRAFLSTPAGAEAAASASTAPAGTGQAGLAPAVGGRPRKYTSADTARLLKALEKDVRARAQE
jgi:hypothetical protein